MNRRGEVRTAGAVLAASRSLEGWEERRAALRALAELEAFEERAGIIEFCANVPQAIAEAWARVCIARVPGAV